MKRNLVLAVVTLVGMAGAYVLAQTPAPATPMGGDMKAMMEKMSPEMKLRCQMVMNTAVSPSDPAAVLALTDQLKLTTAQTAQLQAINKEARDKAVLVLTADQKTTLETMPQSAQTMKDMHEQMMGKMHKMMGGKMGDQPMNCPMMNMTGGGSTTQPSQDKPAALPNHEAH